MLVWLSLAVFVAALIVFALIKAKEARKLKSERERLLTYASVFALDYGGLFHRGRAGRIVYGVSSADSGAFRAMEGTPDTMAGDRASILSLPILSSANDCFN